MTLKYPAFISYRHADNRESGRQWATWLHHAIETYEIPEELIGQKNSSGLVIPERIFPVFRDEDELPADSNLGQAISKALDASETLIVLCSPRAVQSTYVASEIDHFKRSGKSGRILAVIIDGEPNVSVDPSKLSAGWTTDDECFPKPLQIEYINSQPTEQRAEPIAADFRVNENGKTSQGWTSLAAYRQALNTRSDLDKARIDQLCQAYDKQLHLMLMKVIAAILGVSLGELTHRDKAYQLEKERARSRSLKRWLTAVGVTSIAAVSLGGLARYQQIQAQENFAQAQAQTRALYASLSVVSYNENRTIEGLQYALLSQPSPGSYPALYRGLMENREVFLEGDHGTPAARKESGLRLEPLPAQEQFRSCGMAAAFAVKQDLDSIGTYCQPYGKLEEVEPTLSPAGKWIVSDNMLDIDTAIYRVQDGEVFGPASDSEATGLGQISSRQCIAFNQTENTVAYKTFDQQIKVEQFNEYGYSDSSFILKIDACPVGFTENGLLITKQEDGIRYWKTQTQGTPTRVRHSEFEYPEPLELTALSKDGIIQANLNIQSEDSNTLELVDTRNNQLIYTYRNLETEFINSATGYNYPWKIEFSEDSRLLNVFGMAGTTSINIYPDNALTVQAALNSLPCQGANPKAYQSPQTQTLCQLLQSNTVNEQ